MSVTHSDETIAEHARQWLAQKRAEQDAYAAQLAKDQEAKKAAEKATRAHSAKLADANTRAMTYQERAEAAEDRKPRGLKRSLTGYGRDKAVTDTHQRLMSVAFPFKTDEGEESPSKAN